MIIDQDTRVWLVLLGCRLAVAAALAGELAISWLLAVSGCSWLAAASQQQSASEVNLKYLMVFRRYGRKIASEEHTIINKGMLATPMIHAPLSCNENDTKHASGSMILDQFTRIYIRLLLAVCLVVAVADWLVDYCLAAG